MLFLQLIKKGVVFSAVTLLSLSTISYSQTPSQKACSWSGSWQTNYGPLMLTQNGDSLKGNFSESEELVEGVVSGRYVIGKWFGHANQKGGLNMLMSKDCNSFKADRKDDMNLSSPIWNFDAITGSRNSTTIEDGGSANQTFSIGNKNISFELGDNWDLRKDTDGSLIITSKQYPQDIIIYILNHRFEYNSPTAKQKFLDEQKTVAGRNAEGEVITEKRQIFNKNVDLIKIPQIGMKTMVFLPDTGNSYYMMTTTYKDAQKMITAEALLARIMEAMFNAN